MGNFASGAARIVVAVVIIGALSVGGFFLRDFMSGNVTDLKVGDCFDLPTGVETVKDVQHHPCNEAHTAELVGLFEYPGKSGDSYPAKGVLRTYAETQCVPAFHSYTGRDPMTDPLLTLGWMYPTEDGWKNGDHGVNCYLGRTDDGPMTQSYRTATT